VVVHAGKVSCTILVLLVTAVATIIRVFAFWAWELDNAPATTRVWLFTAMVALVAAAVLIPLGFVFDRSINALRRHIEEAPSGDHSVMFAGLSWFRPIARAFIGAVDQFQQRERTLRNQLGDLEIRHRVSEAERRHIEAVLHALRDAVVVTDAFNEIVMANQAAASLLGFELKTAIHKPIDEVIKNERLRQLIRDARDTANFSDSRHVEVPLGGSLAAGGKAPNIASEPGGVFDVTLACVENHKHEVGGVITIILDLSREREVSQMKSEFVS
jgi:PAS domain-containing protein